MRTWWIALWRFQVNFFSAGLFRPVFGLFPESGLAMATGNGRERFFFLTHRIWGIWLIGCTASSPMRTFKKLRARITNGERKAAAIQTRKDFQNQPRSRKCKSTA